MNDEVGDPGHPLREPSTSRHSGFDRLTLTLQPGDGEVVGVGAPIVIQFEPVGFGSGRGGGGDARRVGSGGRRQFGTG